MVFIRALILLLSIFNIFFILRTKKIFYYIPRQYIILNKPFHLFCMWVQLTFFIICLISAIAPSFHGLKFLTLVMLYIVIEFILKRIGYQFNYIK